MRLSTELHDSETFRNFIEIAEKENLMEKKAQLIYPDYDISKSTPELDFKLTSFAFEHGQLYQVHNETGEDLINAAHPDGSVEVKLDVTPSDKLALVETVIDAHKAIEDVARNAPTGKLAALSERLVRIAEKLDVAGFEIVADAVTASLSDINSIIREKVSLAEDGASTQADFQKYIHDGNLKAQKLLNKALALRGLPLVEEDGVMGQKTLSAMNSLGVKPGSYRTWGELYSMLGKAAEPVVQDQSVVTRREGPDVPAQLPAGALQVERHPMAPPQRPLSHLPPMNNDDGMNAEDPAAINLQGLRPQMQDVAPGQKKMVSPQMSPQMQQEVTKTQAKPGQMYMADDGLDARSGDAQMLEQDCDMKPEMHAEDPFALRQKAMEDAKQRLQSSDLHKALKEVTPRHVPEMGMMPKDLPPVGTETFKLTKVRPTSMHDGKSMMPPKQEQAVVPHKLNDVREFELSPEQYFQMNR